MCGYLPLAISIMSGQLKHHPTWTAADLAAELESAADRLTQMTAENDSVGVSFSLSYRELPAELQRLFRHLGLHPGTDIDAYATAALHDVDRATARRLLDNLFGYHLIDEPARGRYRFHDLIRQYAGYLAANDPPAERGAAVGRLLDYYLHTARAADEYLARRTPARAPAVIMTPPMWVPSLPTRQDAVSWMEAERLNLHAAAGYAAEHQMPSHAIALSSAMHGFLRSQGHPDQALSLHRAAVSAARQTGEQLAEADSLNDLGAAQYATGDIPAATATLTQALSLYRDVGSPAGEANALNDLGIARFAGGDYAAAADSLTRALELCRSHGDQFGEATALNILGTMHGLAGEYPAATADLQQALEICRALGDQLGEANALSQLGEVQRMAGEYPAALASLTLGLELSHELGDRMGAGNALTYLGLTQEATGDFQAAIANFVEALNLSRELGSRLGEANALTCLGLAHRGAGNYPAAADSLTQALDLYRGLGQKHGEANVLNILGTVHTLTRDYPAAAASQEEALELYNDVSDPLGQAEVLNNMGELSLASARAADARVHHEQALAIATAITSQLEEARAQEGIGRCDLHDGQDDDGADHLRTALIIYQQLGLPTPSGSKGRYVTTAFNAPNSSAQDAHFEAGWLNGRNERDAPLKLPQVRRRSASGWRRTCAYKGRGGPASPQLR